MPPAPALQGPWVWAGAATNTAFAGPGRQLHRQPDPRPETGWASGPRTVHEGDPHRQHEGAGRPSFPDAVADVPAGHRRGPPAVFASFGRCPPSEQGPAADRAARGRDASCLPLAIGALAVPSAWLCGRGDAAATGVPVTDGAVRRFRCDRRAQRAVAPQYPLWTDGAAKAAGSACGRVEDRRVGRGGRRSPRHQALEGVLLKGRKVETRMLWKSAGSGCSRATPGTRSDRPRLAPEEGIADAYDIAPGRRHTSRHRGLRLCHRSSPAVVLASTPCSSPTIAIRWPNTRALRPEDLTLRSLRKRSFGAGTLGPRGASAPRAESDPVARAAVG